MLSVFVTEGYIFLARRDNSTSAEDAEQPRSRLVAMVTRQQIGQQGYGAPHVAGRVPERHGVLQERVVRPRPMRGARNSALTPRNLHGDSSGTVYDGANHNVNVAGVLALSGQG